jgi:hypothetical protein
MALSAKGDHGGGDRGLDQGKGGAIVSDAFTAARNPDKPGIITLPAAILQEDAAVIDEQENHIVLTVRVPLDLIRDNYALLMALSEIATGKPRPPAEPECELIEPDVFPKPPGHARRLFLFVPSTKDIPVFDEPGVVRAVQGDG